MKRLFMVVLAPTLLLACSKATGPSETISGSWTLTITGLQSDAALSCPQSVVVGLSLTQPSKHVFDGTYTATAAACSGDAGMVTIVNASGTVNGTGQHGQITFTLDTQSSGGGFSGTGTSTSASGTVQFLSQTAPQDTVNGNWTMTKP